MLEICVDTFESAQAAVEGGADRIELCAALSEGGLTPNVGLLQVIKANLPAASVFVMLRPHSRISYIHSCIDMQNILADMRNFIQHGADGFVFGSLLPNRAIDVENCKLIIENAQGLPVTFHRAFDMSVPANRFSNLEMLSNLGFKRLLTSGFAETAELGILTLKNLNEFVVDQELDIIIMPGCGITPVNAERILVETQCHEFHGSAKYKVSQNIPSSDSDTQAIVAALQTNSSNFASKEIVGKLVDVKRMVLKP